MITRDEAVEILHEHLKEDNLIKHSIATEAVMRELARKLGHNEHEWGLTGLLHDLDYTLTADEPSMHGEKSAQMLSGKLPDYSVSAIRLHAAEMNNSGTPATEFDYALRCGETVTGLIMAAGLVRPNGLQDMKPKSLKKKMKDKAFAASVNRDTIREHENIGLDLNEFLSLSITAMQSVSKELGFNDQG